MKPMPHFLLAVYKKRCDEEDKGHGTLLTPPLSPPCILIARATIGERALLPLEPPGGIKVRFERINAHM